MKRIARTCLPMTAATAVAAAALWIALAAPTLSKAAPAATETVTESQALAELYARSGIRNSADLFPGHR